MKRCSIEGCDRRHAAHGLCLMHYKRLRLNGDPLVRSSRPPLLCSVDGCERQHNARGWCETHYRRWRTYGDPLAPLPMRRFAEPAEPGTPLIDRLMARVQVAESGCWEWVGYVHPTTGYGMFSVKGRATTTAHRLVYLEMVGPIPVGLELDHLCRNRACVNPAHLEPVTRATNIMRGEGPSATRARAAARHTGGRS